MAHKTLVDGTAYEVIAGRTLIDGTGYDVAIGKARVDGTNYDVELICHSITITTSDDIGELAYVSYGGTRYNSPVTLNVPHGEAILCYVEGPLAISSITHNGVKVGSYAENLMFGMYTHIVTKDVSINLNKDLYLLEYGGIITIND